MVIQVQYVFVGGGKGMLEMDGGGRYFEDRLQ